MEQGTAGVDHRPLHLATDIVVTIAISVPLNERLL
jgi:hypothetical protein